MGDLISTVRADLIVKKETHLEEISQKLDKAALEVPILLDELGITRTALAALNKQLLSEDVDIISRAIDQFLKIQELIIKHKATIKEAATKNSELKPLIINHIGN